jgi:hypothetical protein
MSEHLAELVRQISPRITARDVSELPLLTLGAQLYVLSVEKLKQESPSTNSWFDVAQVLARKGGEAGIPVTRECKETRSP